MMIRPVGFYLRAVFSRQKVLLLSGISAFFIFYVLSLRRDEDVVLVSKSLDEKVKLILAQQGQTTKHLSIDQDSDTWVGPLPCCWDSLPQNFLVSHPLYKTFKRSDLRLSFKPLTPVTGDDNLAEFPCTQSQSGINLNRNITEDIMCVNRPKYRQDLLNPCFNQTFQAYQNYGSYVQCVPRFHVLGVDKCGTTDFHSRLMAHPQVLPILGAMGKETYWWAWFRYGLWMKDRYDQRGRFYLYYGSCSEAAKQIIGNYTLSGRQLVVGDGSPMDFWDFRGWFRDPHNEGLKEPKFLTPHAMRHIYKDPRFFVLLRDPAERTYSDYLFLEYGKSPQKFAMDVPRAIQLMKNCLAVNSTRHCFFSFDIYHRLPIRLHTSCYSVFLREWLSVFDKRHFFIVRTQDYHNDMERILLKAYDFIGVSRPSKEFMAALVNRTKRHETKTKTWTGKMFPETRALLNEFFARFNQDLAKLLEDKRFLFQTPDNLDGGI